MIQRRVIVGAWLIRWGPILARALAAVTPMTEDLQVVVGARAASSTRGDMVNGEALGRPATAAGVAIAGHDARVLVRRHAERHDAAILPARRRRQHAGDFFVVRLLVLNPAYDLDNAAPAHLIAQDES